MRIISEKCKIMEKKIYTKPENSAICVDTEINVMMQSASSGGSTGGGRRNKSAEATTTDTDELYTNPFGE